MKTYTEEDCPKCGQRLRFPNHVGGVVMKCPECGQKFHSDFKIKGHTGGRRAVKSNLLITAFEFPQRMLNKLIHLFRN